jgi:hypothetical protein
LLDIVKEHDRSKFSEPELSPYIELTWKKRCEKYGELYIANEELLSKIPIATEYHVRNNKHHAESWSNQAGQLISSKDRDDVNVMVDGRLMPDVYICEMVCDWCAVGEEMGNSARSWADMKVGSRWLFTEEQVALIYTLIEALEGVSDA